MPDQPPKVVPFKKRSPKPPLQHREPEEWEGKLARSGKGTPTSSHANIVLILRHTPSSVDRLRYNTFTNTIEIGPSINDEFGRPVSVRVWTKKDEYRLAEWLLDKHHLTAALQHVTTAVESVAQDVPYDPLTTWLDALPPWDEIDRLGLFFPVFCGVPDTPYSRFCGVSLFVSLVARAYQPGCKADTMLVLQGAQGIGKTQLCKLIGGPWYRPLTVSFESKDVLIALRNTWLAELAELDSFSRAGQARIKAMLTTTEDIFRPPYGHIETSSPRRTIFVGTTNDDIFLFDNTGGRRFYPITIEKMTLEGIQESLLDLFAEAVFRYRAHERWWTDNLEIEHEANEKRESVREVDPWLAAISRYCEQHPEKVTIEDIYSGDCLSIPLERRTKGTSTTIGVCMRKLGRKKIPAVTNGIYSPYYVKK